MPNFFGVILKVIQINQKFLLHIGQALPVKKYEKIYQTAFSHSSSSKRSSSHVYFALSYPPP